MHRQRKLGKVAALTLSLCASTLFAEEDSHWDLLTDFVYMQRYHVKDQTIAFRIPRCVRCPRKVALSTKDLASGFGSEPGIHAALSYIQNATSSYELGFVYIWEWENTKVRTANVSNLKVPFRNSAFVQSFVDVSKLEAKYSSQFYTAELNFDKVFSESRHSFLAFSGLGGLRFASLSEKFSVLAFAGSHFGEYDIKTTNDLIGIQIGFGFQINAVKSCHWDLEGKAGVGLNRISVATFLGDQSNTVEVRNFTKQDWQSNIFAEAAAGFGYRAAPALDIHAGYAMLYFCGLALAPDQFDTTSRTTTLEVERNGYVIIHGIYAGFTFSF